MKFFLSTLFSLCAMSGTICSIEKNSDVVRIKSNSKTVKINFTYTTSFSELEESYLSIQSEPRAGTVQFYIVENKNLPDNNRNRIFFKIHQNVYSAVKKHKTTQFKVLFKPSLPI